MEHEERFTDLYRQYHSAILVYALRRVPPERADDVVADAFLSAWRHIEDLPADPLPWLYRAAHLAAQNEDRGLRRQARLHQRLREASVDRDVEDPAEWSAEQAAVAAALDALRPSDREALLLTYWEGLDVAATATVVGCSQPTARVRLYRARRRFAAQLAKFEPTLRSLADPGPATPIRVGQKAR